MSQQVIVHVQNGLRFGGNENLCLQLIRHAPPSCAHVLLNLNPDVVDMREVFERSCPKLRFIDRPYQRQARLSFVARLTADLRRIGASSVIVYPFGMHVLIAPAARAAGVSRVLACAGNPPPVDARARRMWRAIVLASRALRVPIKSCSAMVDRELRRLGVGLPAGSEPIHNGVDTVAIAEAASAARAGRERGHPPVIGMVARLDTIKDHDTLVRAFARVRRELAGCELWLIGGGARREAIAALAGELGIAESVRLLGERSDIPALLGQMDAFAFSTTRDEGFGIALAEAMAAGLPIVASDVEACREVLGGDGGWLVPPQDEERLASALLRLLKEPETAAELGASGLERARRQFDAKICAARYYASLMPERSSTP